MKLLKLLFLFVSVLLVSCATEDEKMQRYLIGNWETIYAKIDLPTYNGKDDLFEYDIDFANPHDPRAKQQGKPLTTFKADGTFVTWSEINNRSTGQMSTGKWSATKDSLYFIYQQGAGKKDITIPLGLKEIEDGYATTRLLDQDRDGKVDDLIYLETVRLPDTKK